MATRLTINNKALSNLVEHCQGEQEHFANEGDKKTAQIFQQLHDDLLALACGEHNWITLDHQP